MERGVRYGWRALLHLSSVVVLGMVEKSGVIGGIRGGEGWS